MDYKFLAGWVEQCSDERLILQDILNFRDQYAIKFKRRKELLQINLASEDCFCFFTEKTDMPFGSSSKLAKMNSILKGATLDSIRISPRDRIIFLDFSSTDITNKVTEYIMIIELIPRFQNLILAQKKDSLPDMILDAAHKFSFAENSQRQILPNSLYEVPGSEYENISEPLELPLVFNRQGKIKTSASRTVGYYQINELFEDLFYKLILMKRIERKFIELKKKVSREIKKKERKLLKLKDELEDTGNEATWKKWADLIKTNLSKIKPGMKRIVMIDYFSSDQSEIVIPLAVDRSPKQNMEFYYRKFKKARDGKQKIQQQLELTEQEIEILKTELLVELDPELYFENTSGETSQAKESRKFRSLVIDVDWEIIVGRTSKENDFLTTKYAKPHDWWFHTRIFRGTHVVLKK